MDDSILLPVGTLLGGQYAVEGVLGKPGGFGVVYLARDTRLDALVAVKEFFPRTIASRSTDGLTLRPNTSDDADALEAGRRKFLEEARLLARFQHPNVVRVRGFFEEHGTAYLVMDYLDGLPLYQYVERQGGRVPYDTALGIAQPILSALTELHEAGVLHRDIDPHNVYITRRGQVVLLDFGSAREATEEATRNLSVVVKPGYAPYEQYGSRARQGPWTDVYAVGAMLYRIVTGTMPPPATERVGQDDLRPVRTLAPDVPVSVAHAIEHALAVQPKDRPQSAAAFEAELIGEGVEEEAPPAAPASAPVAKAAPPRRSAYTYEVEAPPRRGVAWWMWAVPLVVLALVSLYFATRGEDTPETPPVAADGTMQGTGIVDRVDGRAVVIGGMAYRAAAGVDLDPISPGDSVRYRLGPGSELLSIEELDAPEPPPPPPDTARRAPVKPPVDTARAAPPPTRDTMEVPLMTPPRDTGRATPPPAPRDTTRPRPSRPAPSLPPDSSTPDEAPSAEVRVFLDRFLALSERNDLSVTAYYAPRVDRYFDQRGVSRADVADEVRAYSRRWPDRRYTLAAEPVVVDEGPGYVVVEAPVRFRVANADESRSGTRTTRYKVSTRGGRLALREIAEL